MTSPVDSNARILYSKSATVLVGLVLAVFALAAPGFASSEKHHVTGLLISADRSGRTITVSCKEIPGYMDAMVMSFPVRDPQIAPELRAGMNVEFDLVVNKDSSFAQNLRVLPYDNLELDPGEARRLKLLENAASPKPPSAEILHLGDSVPDFHLIDQNGAKISLSQFRGKLVAMTFIYTRCPRPDYCLRLSNNFGVLERRFKNDLGKDLVLLTVVIDPVHDQPDALRTYARTWKADARYWHFATGSAIDIQQLCRWFDMSYYPDEALYVHSFHTVIIGRDAKLASNLEGNNFTAKQLGDLVESLAKNDR